MTPPEIDDFASFARLTDDRLSVGRGALLIARDAYPRLRVDDELTRFDALAAPLVPLAREGVSAEGRLAALVRYLYKECGFHGNDTDYYDPRNSFLNDVLERRVGIPISLAIVVIEVAERVGLAAGGVSFPGHFLVRFEMGGGEPTFVDPFRGALVDREGLTRLLRASTGSSARLTDALLAPATARQTLVRVLTNLKRIFLNRNDPARALIAQTRLVELCPADPSLWLERGSLAERLGALATAVDDFERARSLFGEDAGEQRAVIEDRLTALVATSRTLN